MNEEFLAEVFYGYIIQADQKDRREIEETITDSDMSIVDFNNKKAVLGKSIEKSDIGFAETVSAEELLSKITKIERDGAVRKIEEKLDLKNSKPQLILIGRKR